MNEYDEKNQNAKRYSSNIKINNKNYSIEHFVIQDKLYFSLKYSNTKEYINYYSYRQLQIINKFFRSFSNIEQISNDLDKLLKKNKVLIEENKDYILLIITVLMKKESTNIVFKLLKNKKTDTRSNNSILTNSYIYKDNHSISMPKYEKRKKNNINIDDSISYPIYSPLANKYQMSNKENNNINNVNKNKSNLKEFEIDLSYDDSIKEKSINKSREEIDKKLRNKKNNSNNDKKRNKTDDSKSNEEDKKQDSINVSSSRNNSSNSSIRDSNSNNKIKNNKKLNNKDKTRNSVDNSRESKSSSIKDDRDYDKKKRNEDRHSSSSSKKDKKKDNKRNEKESEDYRSNNSNDKNSSESEEKNKKKKERNDSSSEKNKKSDNNNSLDYDRKNNHEITGLEMPDREDLKKYINSRIFFTVKELQMVKNKITNGNKNKHALFDVLYRASIDGDYEDAIISCTEGIYPQLILFYTYEGARFGVYIEKEKHKGLFGSISYKEVPGTSFLISLNSLRTYNIQKGEKATDNREEKLCFGRSFQYNENESNWFINTPKNCFLKEKCMIGDKESSFGKIDTSEIVGNKKDYRLKDVEIFKVLVEPGEDFDYDDESEKLNKNYVKEKEIKIKNFSKPSKKHKKKRSDIIKIKNLKIEKDEGS